MVLCVVPCAKRLAFFRESIWVEWASAKNVGKVVLKFRIKQRCPPRCPTHRSLSSAQGCAWVRPTGQGVGGGWGGMRAKKNCSFKIGLSFFWSWVGGGWFGRGAGGLACRLGVLFSSAAGGAYWPIAIHCPSLGPFPSIGGGAHRPLTTLCTSSSSLPYPSLSTSLSFPLGDPHRPLDKH